VSVRGAPPYDRAVARRALGRADPELGALMAQFGPCRLTLLAEREPLPALTRSIVYQQLSGKAAATIHARLLAALPEGLQAGSLGALPERRMRGAGLSRAKVAALKDLAARCACGALPDARRLAQLDDEAVIAKLTEVRGVGRWTAEMYLMFGLGRPDVLPLGDLGVRKGFRAAFGMGRVPAPVTVARRGARWQPWRSVAAWYLWRAADGADDAW
jgi:3-methyladenine DNA glycosylase/8-oxoguanine DNA glycosylase